MAAAVDALRAGVVERMISADAGYAMRQAGADGWAPPTYVASGWRSAMVHGPVSAKVIEVGDVVHVRPTASDPARDGRVRAISIASVTPVGRG